MNPADSTLESEIITLVPPPVPKPPRSSLAIAAFVASLVPLPLVYTLSAVPLALASLIGIGRSRTPVRGVGYALAALVLSAAQWLLVAGLAVMTIGGGTQQKDTAEAFLEVVGDEHALRPYMAPEISDESIASLAAGFRSFGEVSGWDLVDEHYTGFYIGDAGEERARRGEYVYRVETASGPFLVEIDMRTVDGQPLIDRVRATPDPAAGEQAGDLGDES